MGGTASSQGSPGHQEALCTGYELPVGLGWARPQLLPSAAPGGAGSARARHPPPVPPTVRISDFRQMLLLKFIRCLRVTQVQLGLRQLEFVSMFKTKEEQTNLGLTVNEIEFCLLSRSNPLPEPSVRSVCLCFVPIGGL